jgi:hypothetical protein
MRLQVRSVLTYVMMEVVRKERGFLKLAVDLITNMFLLDK